MAEKKDDLGKERLQCLAFAHFAVIKYRASTAKQHEESFYSLFNSESKPDNSIIQQYRKYLSYKFDFDRIYNNWVKRKGKGVDPQVKIVYDVAKTFYLSNNISKNFEKYKFLDQEDAFMKVIKNKALDKIIKALKLSFKVDILSSADIYIVNEGSRKKIITEIQKEILNKGDLYLINNFDIYNKILIKYWKTHELFGVSLKLPTAIKSAKNIKIVGSENDILNKKMQKKLDPYTKFLSLLSDRNTNIKKLINDTIVIGNKKLSESSWDFYFTFKYKKLKLYPTDVEFILKSWPKSQPSGGGAAGFNGEFGTNTPGYSNQWVGGTGIETLEKFLFQYPEYNRIMSEISIIRQKALNYTLTGSVAKRANVNKPIDSEMEFKFPIPPKEPKYDKKGQLKRFILKKGEKNGIKYKTEVTGAMKIKNLQSFYSSALREIRAKSFNLGVTRNEKLNKFFDEYEKANGIPEGELMKKYKMAVVNLATKTSVGKKINKSDSMLNTYYEHSQISYFMLRGGSYYLKKRIFLTVFGVITKKGYSIIKESDLNSSKVENAIRVNAAKSLIKQIKSFDTVPHFYMS